MIDATVASETKDAFVVTVRVREGGGETSHEVTVCRADLARLGRAGEPVTAFLERCFRFLLARESKESILRRFDVTVIGRYFPEFEGEITR